MTAPATRPPQRALLYHFTHLDNLVSILRAGQLVADSFATGTGFATDVGDLAIKAARRRRAVPIEPNGVVADYVPFYFAPRSPMMYRIACDHRDAVPKRYPGGDDPLVYLVTSVDRLIDANADWVATDGNASARLTQFTNDVDRLPDLIDWPLMRERYWRDTDDDLDRERRRMAELLVHRRVTVDLLHGCAVRTTQRRGQVADLLTTENRVDLYLAVRPGWYYGFEPRR